MTVVEPGIAAPPAMPIDAAVAAVTAQVRASGTSFYRAMRLLPRPRREAMYAIYAFCRAVDDLADDPLPVAEKLAGLAAWRREIEALYRGQPTRTETAALQPAIARFALRADDFRAVVDGMEMDALAAIRAPDLATLDLYCDRVASAVGRLSVRAFGCASEAADRVAYHQGRALQLTNILRDVAEDAARGRLYLPREILDQHGFHGDDPAELLTAAQLPAICGAVAAMARDHYAATWLALRSCPYPPMRPARLMLATYQALFDRLVARGWDRPNTPVRLSAPTKLRLALRHGLV